MKQSATIPDYVYVGLEKPKQELVVGHDGPQGMTGQAVFDMKVMSEYLFVGSGRQGFSDHYQEAYYTFFRSKDQITVPGTTLKGAVRSVAEAISLSCVSVRSEDDVEVLRGYPRCNVQKGARNIEICPACHIFGTTDYRGHVSFSDAIPNEDIEPRIIKIAELWEPQIIVPKRKFYRNGQYVKVEDQSPRKSYRYIEAIPKGSTLAFSLFFENVWESGLSLVFHSMGIGQDFDIKIGGAKPRCLGSVSFKVREISLVNQLAVSKIKDPESFVSDMLAHKDLIKTEKLEELARKISSGEPCTGG